MRLEIAAALPRWVRAPEVYALIIASSSERAFCAGGDVREMAELGRSRTAEARRALADEYKLNWSLDRFTKPTIALIDGIVMGGGVGLSLYATHRVAGARRRRIRRTAAASSPSSATSRSTRRSSSARTRRGRSSSRSG